MSVMIERLEGMVNRYHEITDLMMMPEITSDNKQLAKLGREQAELTQVVEAYTEYKQTAEALEQAKALLSEDDKELREMAKMEIEELEPKQEQLLARLEILLIPKDPRFKGFQQVLGNLFVIFHIQVVRLQIGQFQHQQLSGLFALSSRIEAFLRLPQHLTIARHHFSPASFAC